MHVLWQCMHGAAQGGAPNMHRLDMRRHTAAAAEPLSPSAYMQVGRWGCQPFPTAAPLPSTFMLTRDPWDCAGLTREGEGKGVPNTPGTCCNLLLQRPACHHHTSCMFTTHSAVFGVPCAAWLPHTQPGTPPPPPRRQPQAAGPVLPWQRLPMPACLPVPPRHAMCMSGAPC